MTAEAAMTADRDTAKTACVAASDPIANMTFADVYREYFAFVWRGARAFGIHQAALDDVVQEIFVVVHRRLADFEPGSPVRPWLLGIAINVVRHHRRSLVRKSPHALSRNEPEDPDQLPALGRGPHDNAELLEESRLFQRLLDSLDDDKREVLVLAELEEMTVPDIAQALGINVNTAYSRLRIAREQFETSLARFRARERWRQP